VVEIERAIARAQAFASMLSPHSSESLMCGMELAAASALGKWNLPVLVVPLDHDEQRPEALRKLSWIPGCADPALLLIR